METHKLMQEQTRRRYQVTPRRSKLSSPTVQVLTVQYCNTARAKARANGENDRQQWREEKHWLSQMPHQFHHPSRHLHSINSELKPSSPIHRHWLYNSVSGKYCTVLYSEVENLGYLGSEWGWRYASSIKRIGAVTYSLYFLTVLTTVNPVLLYILRKYPSQPSPSMAPTVRLLKPGTSESYQWSPSWKGFWGPKPVACLTASSNEAGAITPASWAKGSVSGGDRVF